MFQKGKSETVFLDVPSDIPILCTSNHIRKKHVASLQAKSLQMLLQSVKTCRGTSEAFLHYVQVRREHQAPQKLSGQQ